VGGRHALLVATASYRDPALSQLRTPGTDARRLAELLRDPLIGYFDSVEVLSDPRKQEVEAELDNLSADRERDDLILVYLACHGLKNEHGRLYFAVEDTKLSRLPSTAVSAASVNEIIEHSRAGMKVAMLDCCFGGAFARGFAPRTAGEAQLGNLIVPHGTFVMTATGALEYAYEDGETVPVGQEQGSFFTRAVIEGLTTGDADLDGDGTVSADDLFRYTEREVKAATEGRQVPRRFDVNVSGLVPVAKVPPRAGAFSLGTGIRAGEGACGLGDLLPAVAETPGRGLADPGWPGNGRLTVPLGLAREPRQRDATAFTVDLSRWAGNLAVAGVPQSGKTTLLRALVCALALTHTPAEVQIYCLDFDGDLIALSGLPHVGGVAGELDPDLAAGIVTMAADLAARRREQFASGAVDSVHQYRVRRSRGEFAHDPFGDVFVVIDGWPDLPAAFPDLVEPLMRLAGSGLRSGVHLAVSAPRWTDLPDEMRRCVPVRIELPLSDPRESEYGAELTAAIPAGVAGQGLARGPVFLNIALPRIDGSRSTDDLGAGLADLVARVDTAWHDAPAPRAQRAGVRAGTSPGQTEGQAEGRQTGHDDAARARAGRARRDARRTAGAAARGEPRGVLGVLGMLGMTGDADPLHVPTDTLWTPSRPQDRLRVPIGTGQDGEPVLLDLKPASAGGAGPHGLLIGAAGSGKSWLLRDLVLALALTHSPEQLNFVLVDCLADDPVCVLPHVSSRVSTVSDDLAAERLASALNGEMIRREELLRDIPYDLAPALPALVVIISEPARLSARANLTDLLRHAARTGDRLGVHLLLSERRLSEEWFPMLGAYLSFRIALRTASAAESRTLIGAPDAYELPPVPGTGFLWTRDGGLPVRFQVAEPPVQPGTGAAEHPHYWYTIVSKLAAAGPRALPLLLPPLDQSPTLDQLPMPPEKPEATQLQAVIGIADEPQQRSQPPLSVYFARGGSYANAAIAGAKGTGKSTLAATIVCSLALQYSPGEVQFFLLWPEAASDLAPLASLPHVCAAAGGADQDRETIRRVISECARLTGEREQTMNGHAEASRERRASRAGTEDPYGDVFLVIDDYPSVRERAGDLGTELERIIRDGRPCRVHVVVTARRWNEIPLPVLGAVRNYLELRLDEAARSEVSALAAHALPARPGHGIIGFGTHFLGALPRDDGLADPESIKEGLSALVKRCAERWPNVTAPRLRMLPRLVPYRSLRAPRAGTMRFPVGLDENQRPVTVDFDTDPHLMVFGDAGSGKTSFLRLLSRILTGQAKPLKEVDAFGAPDELSRTLLARHNIDVSVASLAQHIMGLEYWTPGSRARSADQIFWLIDNDAELERQAADALKRLAELIPKSRDMGLHVVIARRTAGAAKALYEPLPRRLTELGTPAILLSGDPREGPLLGVRPVPQPPGRALLVRPGSDPVTVQLAYAATADTTARSE